MYRLGDWDITDDGISPGDALQNGNRLLTGNGYLGRRGVADEAGPAMMPATIISGLYDRRGNLWREPVNAPDPLYTAITVDGILLTTEDSRLVSHEQSLNFRYGLYSRKTVWRIGEAALTLETRRFADMDDVHRLCVDCRISADAPLRLTLTQGINAQVRDLNGPHLGSFQFSADQAQGILSLRCVTLEQGIPLAVCSALGGLPAASGEIVRTSSGMFRVYTLDLDAKTPAAFQVYGGIFSGMDMDGAENESGSSVTAQAEASALRGLHAGWERTFGRHQKRWEKIWRTGDVVIEGDEYAQRCLRYSLYQLHIIAPRHRNESGKPLSIPARGLSGQTYKGAIFWDTEMFIAPYFLVTEPELAAQFIRYRIDTLEGAKRKAAEYGYRGAFYAWESQETGDDACTDFNVTDVFTGRPVRTYFRDKQIHISADIVYAIKKYIDFTGDVSILSQGAMELILEVSRFYLSWLYYSPEKRRYEVLDVIGPDEYHERVNNNAFTNRMVRLSLEAARDYAALLEKEAPEFIHTLIEKLSFKEDMAFINRALPELYMPAPGSDGVIEQFDGYFRLEDCTLEDVRSRIKDPREYWGTQSGAAYPTRIIKQADVVTMLTLFDGDHPEEVHRANLGFYEKRTEHGSSLSACMYALLACRTGDSEKAYPYFIKSAEIDITGNSKHFAGLVYIGGTHPAASGGAWMTAVEGFCGFTLEDGEIRIRPRLPRGWKKVIFTLVRQDTRYEVTVTREGYSICTK
jgi:trehalose/maltose hydrolase-like predicted phosphorylase